MTNILEQEFHHYRNLLALEQELRLSDAFAELDDDISLQLIVRVININPDKHHEILMKCQVLREYRLFIETTRKYSHDENQLKMAVEECIKECILTDYLSRKSSEVVNMLMAEYDYETDMEVKMEEAAKAANEKAQRAEKAAKEANDKAAKASKNLAIVVENTAKNFRISLEEACRRLEISYDDYLEIIRDSTDTAE